MPGYSIDAADRGRTVRHAGPRSCFAFAGPSPAKAQAKRLESVRERHSKSSEVAAQAQLKRIFANRAAQPRMEGFAQRFIPNPALASQAARADRQGAGRSANMRWPRLGLARHRDRCCSGSRALPLLLALLVGAVRRRRPAAFRRRQADQAAHQQVQRQVSRRHRADGARPALGPADLRDDRRRRQRDPGPVSDRVPQRRPTR